MRTRAHASLRAAERLLAEDFPDFAASRAYYAIFYAASALLLADGAKFAKHSGVIAHIHKDYVKTGRLPAEVGKIINALSDLRGVGDYGGPAHVDAIEAARAVADAKQAVAAIEDLFLSEQEQAKG
jgi:uncharacterized protein (UPF0332 family)